MSSPVSEVGGVSGVGVPQATVVPLIVKGINSKNVPLPFEPKQTREVSETMPCSTQLSGLGVPATPVPATPGHACETDMDLRFAVAKHCAFRSLADGAMYGVSVEMLTAMTLPDGLGSNFIIGQLAIRPGSS